VVVIQWRFSGDSVVVIQWQFSGNSMAIQWRFGGDSVVIHVYFNYYVQCICIYDIKILVKFYFQNIFRMYCLFKFYIGNNFKIKVKIFTFLNLYY